MISDSEASTGGEAKAAQDARQPCIRRRTYFCADSKCGCCCCCLLWSPLVLLAVLFIASAAQTFPATKFTNVQYTNADGVVLHAYLATPANDTVKKAPGGQVPGALVFHAWNGMSEEAVYFADQLAAEGYYALAPDLFRNIASPNANVPWNMLNVILTPQDRMDADTDAGFAYLKSLNTVDKDKIVSGPGFCFGGSQSLIFGGRHKSAAVVTLYGTYISNLDEVDTPAWGLLPKGGPILGLYGKLDRRPSVDQVEKFRSTLQKKGMAHTIKLYDGVGHAFVNPHSHKDSSAPGHTQAVEGWSQIVKFFHGVFNSTALLEHRSVDSRSGGSSTDTTAIDEQHTNAAMDTKPAKVPFTVALYHRILCAMKCAMDFVAMNAGGHNMGN